MSYRDIKVDPFLITGLENDPSTVDEFQESFFPGVDMSSFDACVPGLIDVRFLIHEGLLLIFTVI